MPPALAVAGPVFTICKSATGLTPVTSVELLSVAFGSSTPAGLVTVAVLLIVPIALPSTTPLILKVTSAPLGMLAKIPETVLPDTLIGAGQVAPPIALTQTAETVPIEAGTKSLKLAPLAALGPVLRIFN